MPRLRQACQGFLPAQWLLIWPSHIPPKINTLIPSPYIKLPHPRNIKYSQYNITYYKGPYLILVGVGVGGVLILGGGDYTRNPYTLKPSPLNREAVFASATPRVTPWKPLPSLAQGAWHPGRVEGFAPWTPKPKP